MQRYAPRIAAICAASLIAGLLLAETTPSEMRPTRSALEALGRPQITHYPGEDRVITGPDSSPVELSPQYRALLEAQERERVARLSLPPVPGAGFDYAATYPQPAIAQPAIAQSRVRRERAAPAQQTGFETDSGAAAVTVHRAATSQEAAADEPSAEGDEATSPDPTEG